MVKNFGSLRRSGEFGNKSKTSVFQSHIISVKPRTMVLSFFVVVLVTELVVNLMGNARFLIISTASKHGGSSQDIAVPVGKRTLALLPRPPWRHQQGASRVTVHNEDMCRGQMTHGWSPQRTRLVQGTVQLAPEEHMIQTHQWHHPNI